MAFRWSKGFSPLQTIKRGIASLFVCSVVLLPLYFTGTQVAGWVGIERETRSDAPLSAMQVRSADKSDAAVKPFEEPLISVTFDDGWETIYTQAMPLLQKYGIPTTQYVLSGTSQDRNYLSFQQMVAMRNGGHDIQCHSIDHADLTTLSIDRLNQELGECKQVISKRVGSNVQDFASPFGATSDKTIAAIAKTYRSHRNTNGDITTNKADDNDVNTKANFNRYDIIAVTIRRDTTQKQLQAAIDYAVANNGWLVLNYHQIDEGPSNFGTDSAVLEGQLKLISQAKARIATNAQVMEALGY